MVEVEVLYADLSRQIKPIGQYEDLNTDRVLFIHVRTDAEVGSLQNLVTGFGNDFYAFCVRRNAGRNGVMIHGWDNGDYQLRDVDDPHGDDGNVHISPPFGWRHTVFSGETVDADTWAEAERIFNEEMKA